MNKMEELPSKAVCLDQIPPQLADEIKENAEKIKQGISEIAEPFKRLKEIFFSPEGENIQSAESIIRIINLFIQLSIMGYPQEDIPGLIGDRLQLQEKTIKQVLKLTGLE